MKFLDTIMGILKMILGMAKNASTVPSPAPVAKKEATMDPQIADSTPVIDPNTFSAIALPLILTFEGGFVDDVADKGGRTNYGVTQKTYDSYNQLKQLPSGDVKDITDEEVSEIYYNYYWLPSHCDKMPEKVAVVVFDTSVNSGGGRAVKTLQKILGVNTDGVLGPITLAKLMTYDPLSLANSFLSARTDFYNAIVEKNPTQQKFLNGWLRRVNFVKDFVNEIKDLAQIKASW